jgi:hypothetical protein
MTAEMAPQQHQPGEPTDVPDLPVAALRPALEFAVAVAAAGQKMRPPLVFPAGLKPYLKFQKLDKTSMPPVRRALVADEDFRNRLGVAATPELVDEVGIAWLQRSPCWEQRVVELHAAAQQAAENASAEAALRKSERRREAAEVATARAQADLLAVRDDVAREQARREKAEAKAAAASSEAETLRREIQQLQRELEKARVKLTHESDRVEKIAEGHAAADARVAVAEARVVELQAVIDRVLTERVDQTVPESHAATAAVVNREAAVALKKAAASTHDLAEALSRAAGALLSDLPAAPPAPVSPGAVKPRVSKRKPIAIPGGMFGDTVAVAQHLLKTPHVRVIVDGYNVAKLAWPKLELAEQRKVCIETLEDISRRFGTDIHVIFDGADVVGASAGRRLIRVQFSPAGVIADDVIRAEVAALPSKTPLVVVTNDQAIVTDVRNAGANVLSSDTLLALGGRPVKGN